MIEGRIGTVEDRRNDYGEARIKAYGVVAAQLFACPYTVRGTFHRPISVHPVREKETKRWLDGP